MVANIGATRTNDGWKLTLPKNRTVELTEEEAWALGRDLWAKRVHLDPRLRASTTGPSVLEVLEWKLDGIVDSYESAPLDGRTDIHGMMRGLAWAIGAIREPYEDRAESAERMLSAAYVRHYNTLKDVLL